MSDVLLPKTFKDFEDFCLNSKRSRIILSERETFPVYKLKILKRRDWYESIQIDLYRKKESYKEDYERIFTVRFHDIKKGIDKNQVGIFYIPQQYDDGDIRNDLIPAVIFNKDDSIYDNNIFSYFDEGPVLQDLLIKLLNYT